jgi:acyl carrier protein
MTDAITKIFAEVLRIPSETIHDDTSPENTPQWDSVQAMNLVLAIEEAFDIRLTTKEIVSMRTVGIARKVLQAKGVANA